MKHIAALICATFSLVAQAQTITLTGSGCDASRNCAVVANDLAVPVLLYANPVGATFYLDIGGVPYTGQGNGWGTELNAAATATDGSGAQVQIAVTWLHWTTRTVSGRGAGRVVNHWLITGGQITGWVAQ